VNEKVPYIARAVGSEKLCDSFNKYVFQHAVVPNRVQGWNVAEFIATELKLKRVAIFNLAAEYGIAVAEGCKDRLKEFGLELVSHEVMNIGDTDFTSQLLKIKAAKPEVLITPIYFREAFIMHRQIRELGLDFKIITFPPCHTYQFLKEAGNTIKGVILQAYLPNPPPEINPRMAEFFKQFLALHPREDPVDGGIGASLMRIVVEGLRRTGRDLTREKYIAALETLRDFDPVFTSPVTFTPTDHRGNLTSQYWVFEGGGKRTWLPKTITWKKLPGFKYER
ncbi:MAG: ABC transporter substrate-binding protein, partial [candidate division Zixibacteria bacterium]|nr:ABC transporter substrate-binding protein [candidate division Zixibacteria bacterium]